MVRAAIRGKVWIGCPEDQCVFAGIKEIFTVNLWVIHKGRCFFENPVRSIFAVSKHIGLSYGQCSQVRHVEVSVNLFKAAVFMTEVAAFAIRAELLTVELAAILWLVLVILAWLLLLIQIKLVIFAEFLIPMSILTFGSVAAESSVCPVLAHFSFVHGPLYKALASQKLGLFKGGFRAILVIEPLRFGKFDRWDHVAVMRWHKSLRLLEAHVLEWVHLGRGEELLLSLLCLLLGSIFALGRSENEGCACYESCRSSSGAHFFVNRFRERWRLERHDSFRARYIIVHSCPRHKVRYKFFHLVRIDRHWCCGSREAIGELIRLLSRRRRVGWIEGWGGIHLLLLSMLGCERCGGSLHH